MPAELLNFAEDFVDLYRVLAQDAALLDGLSAVKKYRARALSAKNLVRRPGFDSR